MAQEPKQIIAIPELDSEAGAAQMELSTEKYDNGRLVSAAHIHFVKDGMLTLKCLAIFARFFCALSPCHTEEYKHATRQHFRACRIDALKAEALAFYAAKKKTA